MKTILVGSIMILLSLLPARAQEHTPRTSEGDRALLFSINGFGDFGVRGTIAGNVGRATGMDSSLGAGSPIFGAGAKLFIAPKTAVRVGLGLGVVSLSSDSGGSGGGSASAFAISPAIEMHIVQAGSITGYVGGSISYARMSAGSGGESSEYANATSSIGIGGLLGVEFFAWDRLSFGAEYQIGARFNSSSVTAAGRTIDGAGTTELGIATVAVRLGVYL
jgi:hypothetical protein